jgi:uncharacterized membrane protein
MPDPGERSVVCEVCGQTKAGREVFPLAIVNEAVFEAIQRDHPGAQREGWICSSDLSSYRMEYIKAALEKEKGELTALEEEVVQSIREQETIAKDINKEYKERATLGERMADRIAAYGGSWRFILFFVGILILWVIVNTLSLVHRAFDPYPFIFLNLILSCLAALQAPVIMMSQNRQEAKDRLRSEYDYRVNLKAELEVRYLHQKLDHFLKKEWQTLLEIQEIQIDLMSEISGKKSS